MNAAEFAPFIPAGQMPRSRIFRQSYLTVWFYVGQIDRVEVEGAFNSLSGFTEGSPRSSTSHPSCRCHRLEQNPGGRSLTCSRSCAGL